MTIVRKITSGITAWCADNSPAARLERTIVQGIIAAVTTGLATGQWGAAFVVASIMAILAPIQAIIGEADADKKDSE